MGPGKLGTHHRTKVTGIPTGREGDEHYTASLSEDSQPELDAMGKGCQDRCLWEKYGNKSI